MSEINRYRFLKKMYPNYLIILLKNRRYRSFGIDLNLLKYNYFELDKIKKRHISYVILDNLKIVDLKKYEDNKYNFYVKILFIKKVIDFIYQ